MDEYEIRELCNRFFDAYQDGRVDVLDASSTPTTASSGTTSSGARPPARRTSTKYPDSYTGQRRRTYNDRIINTFHDGFVIQYTLNGVMKTGHKGALWLCIVGQVRGREDHPHRRVHGLGEVRAWPGWEDRR